MRKMVGIGGVGAWMIVACIAVAMPGCHRKSSSSGTGPTASASAKFRVALILPGSEADKGWNQKAKEGLDRIETELGAVTKFSSNVPDSEYANRIAYYAGDGYDVIICHGHEFENAVAEAAKKYPKTKFIIGGSSKEIAGAVSVDFAPKEASELVGMVAANVSKTKKGAFVGAQQAPALVACYDGMVEGTKQVPGMTMLPAQWTGSWESGPLAKEKTEGVIAAGADVVYQNVDSAASGVFEAVKKANSPGRPVYAFGCNGNQNEMAPEVILGSVVIDVQRAYLDVAREAKQGNLKAGVRMLGLKGGYVDLVLNDKHPVFASGELRAKVDAMRKDLVGK
jgi:basic membrane protein A